MGPFSCSAQEPVFSTQTIKNEWQEMQVSRSQSYGKMMITNLSYSEDRSQKIYEETVAEANKQGTSTAKGVIISNKLAEIKVTLDRSQTNLNRLKVNLEPQNANQITWKETRQLVAMIIKDLRLAHGKIKGILKLLDN